MTGRSRPRLPASPGGGMRGRGVAPLRDERGSEAVETAILLPVILLLIGFIVVGARLALADVGITGVAGAAARAASISRDAATAAQAAEQTATEQLSDAGLHCTDVTVTTDTSGFSAPVGSVATVAVDVWCTVGLADAGPGLPGEKTLHDRAVSPIDTARSAP